MLWSRASVAAPCTMCTLHAETSRLLAAEEADTEVSLQDRISYVWSEEKVGWAGPPVVLQKVPSEANPKVRNHGEGPY